MAFDRGRHLSASLGVGDVNRQAERVRQPFAGRRQGWRVTVEQHDVVMVLGENLGRRQTNAACGAGDQDCFHHKLKSPPARRRARRAL